MDYLVENNINVPMLQTAVIADNIYEIIGSFSINAANQLIGAIWINKNGQKMFSDLGQASFTFYNQLGISIGLSESGISANANSDFLITPQSSSNILDLSHYTVKLEVFADNQIRRGQVGIPVS